MATVLVTGATGTVGYPIAERLAAQGQRVRALVRDLERARAMLPDAVETVRGDVSDARSVSDAMAGCQVVYHAAGLPEQWRLDPGDFVRVNVEGTRNLVEAALAAGVERFVYTSTIDVFAWRPGEPFDESVIDPDPRPTHYERSKQEADRIVTAAIEQGLPAVTVHPSAVYGPAPVITPGLNRFLSDLARRKVPALLPGGMPVVLNEDVAEGHLLAARSAAVGSRYILSDRYLTLVEIAEAVRRQISAARVPRVMPVAGARALAAAGEAVARLTRRPPLIARGELHFVTSHPVPVALRAADELGWSATPFDEGLARTIAAQAWQRRG